MSPLLVLFVIFVLSASSQDIWYVRPNTSSSHQSCPDDQPCFTLDQYIEEDNFTAGSTFVFLAGNHTPHHQMNLTDIGHVTLRGEDKDSLCVYSLL